MPRTKNACVLTPDEINVCRAFLKNTGLTTTYRKMDLEDRDEIIEIIQKNIKDIFDIFDMIKLAKMVIEDVTEPEVFLAEAVWAAETIILWYELMGY